MPCIVIQSIPRQSSRRGHSAVNRNGGWFESSSRCQRGLAYQEMQSADNRQIACSSHAASTKFIFPALKKAGGGGNTGEKPVCPKRPRFLSESWGIFFEYKPHENVDDTMKDIISKIRRWWHWYGPPYFPFYKRCCECGGYGQYYNSYDTRTCTTCEGVGMQLRVYKRK